MAGLQQLDAGPGQAVGDAVTPAITLPPTNSFV
jgi:hypothetical protein